jgi:hypothetical protein
MVKKVNMRGKEWGAVVCACASIGLAAGALVNQSWATQVQRGAVPDCAL